MRQIHALFPEPPEGYKWEEFEYFFDNNNTPILATQLMPGQQLLNVPLQLQTDAPFLLRAIQINDPQKGVRVRFRDSFGRILSDDFVPAYMYASFQTNQGPFGLLSPILDPALLCPAGSVILFDVING